MVLLENNSDFWRSEINNFNGDKCFENYLQMCKYLQVIVIRALYNILNYKFFSNSDQGDFFKYLMIRI